MAGEGGGGGAPTPKADEPQPYAPKDQLPNVSYCITSPPPWIEAILLGFQHYLVMLGTNVLIPTPLVPRMGGGNGKWEQFSMHKVPDAAFKDIIDTAMQAHTIMEGKSKPKASKRKPQWICPRSHWQSGGSECGFYIMKHMLNIVSASIIDH